MRSGKKEARRQKSEARIQEPEARREQAAICGWSSGIGFAAEDVA